MSTLRASILVALFSTMIGCGSSTDEVDSTNNTSSTVPSDTNSSETPSTENNNSDSSDNDGSQDTAPNILLIIADDQGIDASAQFSISADIPNTPNINALAETGLVFENTWATPQCTTTRGSIITGQHGVNSGIDQVPDFMPTDTLTLQSALGDRADTAVIGKWHLTGGDSSLVSHPVESGVDYYAGNIAGTIEDYNNWPLTENGNTFVSTDYHASVLTDLAIDWVSARENPWFLWLAYVSPHSPFHLPPSNLHSRTLSSNQSDIDANPRPYYLAAIEAMDTEIGRLIATLPAEVRDNTLIIYIGDNGTPAKVIDTSVFSRTHSKSSLYEGGIKVPMIVSGAGVTRQNEREPALVNSVDLFATIIDVHEAESTGIDGVSFLELLTDNSATTREFNYSEFVGRGDQQTGWTVRDDQYKLIEFSDGTQELYDLDSDIDEQNNLIENTQISENALSRLVEFGGKIRQGR